MTTLPFYSAERQLTLNPVHTSNEELKERCHQVVEAMMDLESERSQARSGPSNRHDNQLFNRVQVQEMLDKALQIGLDSLPIAAQHFGKREAAEETYTEPQTSAAATTPEHGATGPSPDGADGGTPNTQAAAAETEGSATPENNLLTIPKSVTPQAQTSQAVLGAQQILRNTSEVLLETNGQSTIINIRLTPKQTTQTTGQAPVARVEVSAPSTFSTNIEDLRDMQLAAPPTLPADLENPHNVQATAPWTFSGDVDYLLSFDSSDFAEWPEGMGEAMET